MRTTLLAVLILVLAAPVAFAHAERHAFFPDGSVGAVPKFRSKADQVLYVCKKSSAKRIKRSFRGHLKLKRKRLRQLKRCHYRHIQAAVNAAHNGAIIRIMPGVYREQPSRKTPEPDQRCAGDYDEIGSSLLASGVAGQGGGAKVANFEYQRKCPNAQNLIAIIGDGPDSDRVCDSKCNLQIEGMGRRRRDVLISGQRTKLNVIRADRADGIALRNFTVEYSDFNNVYILETNGFRMARITSRYSREYGFLSFTSDHGLYDRLTAFGSGDSGIYPGSGPEGHCERYGIEIKRVNSFHNTIGYSGTAGNGVWAHDNRFHHNATGLTTDSFASGHPGMPQDCAKWEHNWIYSNNQDYFNDTRDAYCKNTPIAERNPKIVCPTFQVPVGTGFGIFGGNRDIVRNNYIWDNWRDGMKLLFVPAAFRGEPDKGIDTSFDNRFADNHFGVRPDGTRDPNGNDVWWDEEGSGNCWSGNVGPANAVPTSNVITGLPDCPGSNVFNPGIPTKTASQATCATWDPFENPDPPGCDWFTRPEEPK
ncbi:MAG TPA: hypothetical protein VFX51_23805 [Solirubrobacteraceae bacterium]|nr:hypothetical protein [Solirubrobacteraceae bacterium]